MSSSRDAIVSRVKRIQRRTIEYVPSDSFDRAETPALSKHLDDASILTADEERALFLAMNQAKCQADKLRKLLPADDPHEQLVETIERLLDRADDLRNRLLRVFMKLGASIARGFSSAEFPYDELASEANITLFRAIERFDCDRGFRFSTYATHAVRRNLARYLTKRRKASATVAYITELDVFPEQRKWTWAYEQRVARANSQLDGMMYQLEPRDQFIIRSRFGLGEVIGSQSLQSIADVLGVTRERVRQLEVRATQRLRSMARENAFEPLDA
jgi:RNA polymerase sigma factor (sigma-70 family)